MDTKKIIEQACEWIVDFFEHNGKGCNAVLGISGGKDSSVAAALCVKALFDGIVSAIPKELALTEQARVNLAPRLRMSTLYAVSQCCNGRVVNTCNLSEDWVGYSTRYGDSVGDFSPLSHLTVTEVKQIGRELGLPNELVDKAPSDGLSGKTDEDNLGFTYDVLDKYIRTGVCEDEATKALIDRKHEMNLFKLQLMPSFEPKF